MASRLPESVQTTDLFMRVEHTIKSVFASLMHQLTMRRDQLLLQLHEMKMDYLNKRDTRQKQLTDLDELIQQLKQATIQQNVIVKIKSDQIQRLETHRTDLQQPPPTPCPRFSTDQLMQLKQLIAWFGDVRDGATLYRTKFQPVRCIGKGGKGKGELNHPSGIQIDENGNIYVADKFNYRIQMFSLEGQFIRDFGEGELGCPHDIALSKEWAFISDPNLNAVIKYSIKNYKLVSKSHLKLGSPLGLTIDKDEVFLADCTNNRIVVLNLDLKLIRELGKNKLMLPADVKVINNNVFVADTSESHNIHLFSKSGDLIKSIITLRYGTDGIFICLDKFTNNILISDFEGKIIQIFTLEGHLIHRIVCDYSPAGIAVTPDNCILCVNYFSSKINLY